MLIPKHVQEQIKDEVEEMSKKDKLSYLTPREIPAPEYFNPQDTVWLVQQSSEFQNKFIYQTKSKDSGFLLNTWPKDKILMIKATRETNPLRVVEFTASLIVTVFEKHHRLNQKKSSENISAMTRLLSGFLPGGERAPISYYHIEGEELQETFRSLYYVFYRLYEEEKLVFSGNEGVNALIVYRLFASFEFNNEDFKIEHALRCCRQGRGFDYSSGNIKLKKTSHINVQEIRDRTEQMAKEIIELMDLFLHYVCLDCPQLNSGK